MTDGPRGQNRPGGVARERPGYGPATAEQSERSAITWLAAAMTFAGVLIGQHLAERAFRHPDPSGMATGVALLLVASARFLLAVWKPSLLRGHQGQYQLGCMLRLMIDRWRRRAKGF